VLAQANITMPNIMPQLEPDSMIALVDHNESAQSIDNRSNYIIHSVIDHHKIGDLET
jgi:manganese-dependent inorganic pyrophosphatase